MSDAALAIFGIIFGWGLCAFVLRWNRPLIFRHLDPAQWRRFPRYRALPRLNEGGRKQLEKFEAAFAEQRLTAVRWWFGAALFVAAAVAILLVLLEQAHWRAHEAWEIETFLSTPRLASFMLTAALGFGCRAYWQEIVAGLYAAFLIALVSTSKDESKKPDAPPATAGAPAEVKAAAAAAPADTPAQSKGSTDAAPGKAKGSFEAVSSKFPWFVEIGILASMVVAVVLLINPQLLRNVTSFKAGGVEAHFATANGTATVLSGQLVTVDLSRKRTTQGWTEFVYPPQEDDYRFKTYPDDHESQEDRKTSAYFFDSYLYIIFKYLSLNKPIPFDLKMQLRRYISDVSTSVETGDQGIDENTKKTLVAIRPTLCKSVILHDKNTNISDVPHNEKKSSDEIRREYVLNNFCIGYDQEHYAFQAPDIKIKHWDPYIIQAVGDLLFVIYTRREQEDFLVAATKNDKSKDEFCPENCRTAGQLSLAYAVTMAKIRSERPWPFQQMIDDLEKTLVAIDTVLGNNRIEPIDDAKPADNKKLFDNIKRRDETDLRFRRNRLIDLSLGLELFYQRALQGQKLTAAQRQTWRDWLTEVKSFLDLSDAVAQWPPPFDDDTLASWKRVRDDNGSRPDILQDAYVGAALSLVLVDPNDDVAPHDCATALSFLKKSDDAENPYATSEGLDEDEKGTYLGFLERVRAVVEGRCRA